MGKISTYEQNQLASSLVGTPGVDTSTGALFSGLSQVFGGVGQEISSVARQNQVEIFRLQREQRAAARAQKDLLDNVNAAAYSAQWDLKAGEQENDIKTKNILSPKMAPKAFSESANAELEKFLGTIGDEDVRNKVRLNAIKDINSRANSLNNWSFEQNTVNAQNNLNASLDALVMSAGNAKDDVGYNQTIQKINGLAGSMLLTFGAKSEELLVKARQDAAKQYFEGYMARGEYNRVAEKLRSGQFDKVLPADERGNLIKEADSYEAARQRDERFKLEVEKIGERTQIAETIVNTDENDLGSIRETNKYLRSEFARESSLPPAQQNTAKINQLKSEIQRTQKLVDDWDKDERQRKIDERKIIHDSQAGLNARLRLDKSEADFTIKAKQGFFKGKSQEAKKAIERIQNDVQRNWQAGFLTEEELRRYNNFIKEQQGKLRPPRKTPLEQIGEISGGLAKGAFNIAVTAKDSLWAAAASQFAKQANIPAPGKTREQTHAQLNTEYRRYLDTAVAKYTKLKGKPPSDAVLRRMDADARAAAQGKTYGQ